MGMLAATSLTVNSQTMNNPNLNTSLAQPEQLTLVQEWDKVFSKSDKVDHKKVTFTIISRKYILMKLQLSTSSI